MEVNKNENTVATLNNESRWSKEMDSESLNYWFDYYTGLFQNAIDTQLLPKDHVLLNALKYNLLNEGRGTALKVLYDDILEYQNENNPVFNEEYPDAPFANTGPYVPEPVDPNAEQWDQYIFSDSQIKFLFERIKEYTNAKGDAIDEAEAKQLNELVEQMFG